MFYSQFILAKKGPLGTIWIAAHLERKLRKNQVADTDIGFSVDSILFPEVPIALRLSSHLLLGVVRIYSRKVNYLFDDCSEALLKIKQAFRSTAVDLPPEESTAPYHSITLPETFDLDDFELPDSDIFQGNYVDHHISSREQITLQDTMEGVVYSTSQFGLDERFGDGDTSGLDLDEFMLGGLNDKMIPSLHQAVCHCNGQELLMSKVASEGHTDVLLRSESNADPQPSDQLVTPLKKDEDQDTAAANLETTIATTSINQIDDLEVDADHVEYAQAPCTPGLWEEPNLSIVQETSAFDDHLETENHNLTEFTVTENIENATSNSEFYNGDKSVEAVDLDPTHSVSVVENGYHPDNPELDQLPQEKSSEIPVTAEQKSKDMFDSVPLTNSVSGEDIRETSPVAEMSEKITNASPVVDQVENNQNVDVTTTEPCNLEVESNMVNIEFNIETPLCPDPQLSNSFNIPALRPCTTYYVSEKSLEPEIPFEGEGSIAIDGTDRSLKEINIDASSTKSVDGADNIISGNSEVDNFVSPTSCDLPTPEKLLSVPEELANVGINLLPGTTPDKEVLEGGDGGSITLEGKKRSFDESASTVQSINAAESYGVFSTKMTAGSVPDDDDLLSSILVGRKSSMMKVKSTPPTVKTSMKRRRSAPRTGASKRKVLLDDTMVLHGDTIRQQLTNTEDIRRIRKKAPCTRPEISMIQKQFWEDELFTEPIFTGVSMELASLHNQVYDLTAIRIIQTDASLESAISIQLVSQSDQNTEVKENSDVQPVEPLVLTVNQHSENNTTGPEFCGSEVEICPSTCVTEPRSSEHDILGETTPMEIDGTDLGIQPLSSEQTNGADASQPDEMDDRVDEGGVANTSVIAEEKDNVDANKDELVLERIEVAMSIPNDGDCLEHIQTEIPTVDQVMEEVWGEEQKLTTDSPFVGAEEFNAKNFGTDGIYGDELVIDPSFSAEVNLRAENVLIVDGENPNQQEDYPLVTPNADISAIELEDRLDSDYAAVGHDTEFLNVDDDDDEAEADGDYVHNAEEAGFIDNSGWSTRTRAVAKYLQTLFDKESERGRNVLPVENLLAGKTRKEASRMFFETLVLKTKDFIHVEQPNPYDNINLLPRVKLMKSDF